MRTKLKGKLSLLFLALAMLLAFPAVAIADNIIDDVNTDANDTSAGRTITQGGSTTVEYWIVDTNKDGQKGCNASDATPVTITINKSADVSADKSQLTFTKCKVDNEKNSQSVVFSSDKPGTYTISVSTDGGAGTFNTDPAGWKLQVDQATGGTGGGDGGGGTENPPPPPADTTAPVLSLPPDITEEATGPNGAQVTYSASANDAVDGPVTVNCLPASDSTFALGTTPVNCSASDAAGNTATSSFTVTVRDTTAPQLTVPSDPIVVEATSASGAPVNFASQVSAQDAVDSSPSISCTPASESNFGLGTTQVSCKAKDAANNTSDAKTFDVRVVDTTAPVLSNVPNNITATATSSSGAVVNYTNPTASDAVDPNPVVTCTPASGSNFGLGTTQVSCTAKDAANNTSDAKTFNVKVAYSASGFLQPINTDDSSVFKLGSTVPVKFQLTGDSAGITDATANLKTAYVTSGIVGTEVEASTTTAASTGSLFRYDATSNQYIYNWGTKGLSAGTYQLRIDLGDGVGTRTVQISLKK